MIDLEDSLDPQFDDAGGANEPAARAGMAIRMARTGVHNLLQSLGRGRLHLQDPLGQAVFGAVVATGDAASDAPDVALRVTDQIGRAHV